MLIIRDRNTLELYKAFWPQESRLDTAVCPLAESFPGISARARRIDACCCLADAAVRETKMTLPNTQHPGPARHLTITIVLCCSLFVWQWHGEPVKMRLVCTRLLHNPGLMRT